jgi:gamma-glutamylcyclotransferase (GGCT)/AIG2-like uncharacterized protein YtfP
MNYLRLGLTQGLSSDSPFAIDDLEPAQLFVYGTLRSFFHNKHALLLRKQAEFLGVATVQGRLYAIADYPGLVLSGNSGERVIGEVYRLREPRTTLAELDTYEGAEYQRVTVEARLNSDEITPAWVYIYRPPVDEAKRIQSGDFLDP